MSGGGLNYLCYKEPEELFHYLRELEEVEQELLTRGAQDVARDVRRLIEYIKSAEIRISILSEQLNPIFRAVEWRLSGDIGDNSLLKVIEEYRTDKEEKRK